METFPKQLQGVDVTLMKAEMAEHEALSIAYPMKAVRFPAYKGFPDFDFAASKINEAHQQGPLPKVS
ncbi:hypothetical protein [Roseibium alexandrii]|uniref:hypothetical protein n=1 Tax=Roseibium alexandrii TaxID=388408 RepID=UPI000AD5C416